MNSNLLTNISRLLVGSLFIVSGLIKANDPIGFSYKLEEYFSADVLGIEWLASYALAFALLICIAEIVLGVALLLGAKIKPVSWALLLMNLFFTFLTFYSAYYNKVTDCGCFGDALKITPWESFSKDVVLLGLVILIFIKRRSIVINTIKQDFVILSISLFLIALFSYGVIAWGFPVLFSFLLFAIIILVKKFASIKSGILQWTFIGASTLASILFTVYCIRHLPLKDFRPYKTGTNIIEKMNDGTPDVIEIVFTYKHKQTGEVNEFDQNNLPKDMDNWQYVDRKDKIIVEGKIASIHDFSITSSDEFDYTEEIIRDPNINFLLIAYDITTTNKDVKKKVNEFAAACSKAGISFIGLSASTHETIDEFRHEVQAMYDYYSTDETTLKTIIRSNPGLMMLKDGVILKKWHYNDFPGFDEASKL